MIDIKKMIRQARYRAKAKGIPFNVHPLSIPVPNFCPILGIELIPAKSFADDHSPTLDRIKPELGYVVGNVMVVSNLANRIKSNATTKALSLVAKFVGQPHFNKDHNASPNLQFDPILDRFDRRGAVDPQYNPTADLKQPPWHDSGNIPPEGPHPHYQARYPDADGGAVHCHCEHG